jgi:hypothetical protein
MKENYRKVGRNIKMEREGLNVVNGDPEPFTLQMQYLLQWPHFLQSHLYPLRRTIVFGAGPARVNG